MGNIKEYATLVRIEGQPEGLKPGMTAEVEILVAYLPPSTLSIPVAAIVQNRDKFLCWVRKGEKVERKPLLLGMSNDKFVEVKDGLVEGEEVLLNPRAVSADAREVASHVEEEDVSKKFGDNAKLQNGKAAAGDPVGEQGRRGGDGSKGGRGGRRGGGDLMSNDSNGDGKVSREEAGGLPENVFDAIDQNKDGFLDKSETDAARQRRGGGGRKGGGREGGREGDGGGALE
jgi:hypothetical protein